MGRLGDERTIVFVVSESVALTLNVRVCRVSTTSCPGTITTGIVTTVREIVTERRRDPLVPITVTVKVPGGKLLGVEIVSVEVAFWPDTRTISDGVNDVPGPDGETLALKPTSPVKPFALVRLTVIPL